MARHVNAGCYNFFSSFEFRDNMFSNPANSFTKKLFSAARNVFWLAAWLASLSLILLYPLRWLFGDSLEPVRAISYITPWLLVFSLPMLIIAGLKRRKWLSFVLAIGSLAIGFNFAPLFLPNRQATPSPNSFPLKIMSYNLHGIQKISGIVEVIRQEKPDILLVQEYSSALVSPSFHGLDDLYPELYVDVDSKGFGQAIFSCYPLKQLSVELDTGRTQKILLETPSGPIAVWNVHPIPPYIVPPKQYDMQMSALAADISKAKGPLIVAGDFNATDQSEAYRMISRYLKDAYWETGSGFGFSYPAPPYTFMDLPFQTGPLWRIDHIFHSQDFIVTGAHILRTSGGSDHFPVVAELSIVK
jgi:endonuclease/exonuclease/phosphatase (EEP) superfamily protein YafD